jgi:predicted DNA-binding protein (UPF0278 family)
MTVQNSEKSTKMINTMTQVLHIINNDELNIAEDIYMLAWILRKMFDMLQQEAQREETKADINKSRQLIAQMILQEN